MFRNIPETPPTQPLYSGDLICYDSVTKEKPTSIPRPLQAHLTTTVTILICLYHHSSSTETVKFVFTFQTFLTLCAHVVTMLVQLPYLSLNYIVCMYIKLYKYQIIQFLYRCPFLSLCNYILSLVKCNKKGPVQMQ